MYICHFDDNICYCNASLPTIILGSAGLLILVGRIYRENESPKPLYGNFPIARHSKKLGIWPFDNQNQGEWIMDSIQDKRMKHMIQSYDTDFIVVGDDKCWNSNLEFMF